jgi:hypothetical protein
MAKKAYLVKRRPRAPSRMEMGEISEQLAFLAEPFVAKALRAESLAAASVWKAEAVRALGPLLREPSALEAGEGGELVVALEQGLERPAEVTRAELREHAAQTGRAIASAWLQFLALALGKEKKLALGEGLLPAERAAVRLDLWEALEQSMTAYAIGFSAVPKILQGFADGFVQGATGLKLPFGLRLEASAEAPFLLRRCGVKD